jgi:hypothetical protein
MSYSRTQDKPVFRFTQAAVSFKVQRKHGIQLLQRINRAGSYLPGSVEYFGACLSGNLWLACGTQFLAWLDARSSPHSCIARILKHLRNKFERNVQFSHFPGTGPGAIKIDNAVGASARPSHGGRRRNPRDFARQR